MRGGADAELSRDLAAGAATSSEQHDARAADDALRSRAGTNPRAEQSPILVGYLKSLLPHGS